MDGSFAIAFREAGVPAALPQQRCWAACPACVVLAAAFPSLLTARLPLVLDVSLKSHRPSAQGGVGMK